jgi:type IV pilus assembly protein PilC
MRSYTYIARDHTGTRRDGLLAANSAHEALEILHHKHLTPIGVHETVGGAGKRRKIVHRGRVRSADLGAISWQLSTMLDGGLSITTALEIIAEDTDNLQLRHVLQQTLSKVAEGKLLSEGLSEFPHVFNRLALAIVIAGETSGDLGQALQTLAEYFDSRDRIAKKVRSAVAYPIFVLTLITGIVIGIMTLIIPRFQMIFTQIGSELPAFTRVFLGFYNFLCHNALYVAVALLGAVFGAMALSRTPGGHRLLSRAVLRLPLFGKLFSEAFVAMFCRTIATLLQAGVPVLEAFEILRDMSANDVISSAIAKVKQHVMGGSNIALGMTAAGFFPNMVIKMAQVGEESGSLPMILQKTSDHYERKITATIDTLTRLLEPVMITTVGAVVLVVVIALYLPIFTISDVH